MSGVEIVGPSGKDLPPSDPHEILALDLVQSQRIHLARLQNRLGARQARIVRSALEAMAARLVAARIGDRDPWNQARMFHTMLMLARGLTQMVGTQKSQMTADLSLVARQSQKDAARYLATLDRHFHGVARPLNFDSLAWWEQTHKNIGRVRIQHYTRSWLRYGATITGKVKDAMAENVLLGEPWWMAREKVTAATYSIVHGNQSWVDRILVTESSAAWNGTQLAALQSEDEDDDPMLKKLVAHFDIVTGRDSVLLHGQTRPVDKPFWDAHHRKSYMAPPNRPRDREIIIGWRHSYGEDFDDYDKETATDYDKDVHGETKRDLDQTGQAEDPTGWLRPTRPKKRSIVYETEPTSTERRDQLKSLRLRRDMVVAQLAATRASVAHLKRQAQQQGGEVGKVLAEQYRTKAELAETLSKQAEEYRGWIDLVGAGAQPV